MQLLEFLVLLIAVRFDNGGDKEPLQRHAVVSEVRNQQLMDALGKCGEMLINFKNIDGAGLHHLGDVGLDPGHEKCPEKAHQLLLTQEILRAHQLHQQLAAVLHPQAHFAAGTDGKREAVGGLNVLHLAVRAPFHRHLLGLIDEVDLAVEGGGVAGGPIQQLADFGDVLRFQRVAPGAEQVQGLAVHKENCFL